MKSIVCFGDSNTYGYNPNEGGARYAHTARWTGLLGQALGEEFRVIEEGLNGRTTGFSDSIEPYRNGAEYIIPCVLSHAPFALFILMLGTNDTKERYHLSAAEIGYSMEELLRKLICQLSWLSKKPEILLVAPMPLEDALVDDEFSSASIAQSKKLPAIYERLSGQYGLHYLDASRHVSGLGCDHIHLSADGHAQLAHALTASVRQILD